ncbi:DNA-binding MarR family transcriptional regulator [Pseudonocardia sediminis]|uniref:DNA-binding MarR family transcriptional regulator n=1 Tax=Pseudonocardia sediminis TaxID=1397368 RepID=A0A4Q7UUW2_PSEST|nr:DNA-binding MarR family transcriptional regulator [Pseudonocardia sediminis]
MLLALAGWQIPIIQLNGMIADRLGVTWTDLQALYVLANHGPATPGELAKRVNLTTGSASRMIDRLDAAGFVRRVPDPADRRRVLVEPVPEGLDRVAAFYDPLVERHRADLADLGPAELATLLRFMERAESSTEARIRDL